MIRIATNPDALDIANVHVSSWQVVYRGHFPDEHLDSLRIGDCSERWAQVISSYPNNVAVYESESRIIGFVSLIDSRDEDAEPDTGEISAMYIDPVYWRRGIGSQLMAWVKEDARARGWRKMTLWVLRGNELARAFYSSHGWCPDGCTKLDEKDGFSASELRYQWLCST